jgi:hypothetical protein
MGPASRIHSRHNSADLSKVNLDPSNNSSTLNSNTTASNTATIASTSSQLLTSSQLPPPLTGSQSTSSLAPSSSAVAGTPQTAKAKKVVRMYESKSLSNTGFHWFVPRTPDDYVVLDQSTTLSSLREQFAKSGRDFMVQGRKRD